MLVESLELNPSPFGKVLEWLEGPILLPGKSKPFDVIEDPIAAGDAPLYFFHVVFLLCFDVANFSEYLREIRLGSAAGHKWFNF